LLEDGARVVGDIRAPRVVIAPGALVRGMVDTGQSNGAAARPSRAQPAIRPAPAPARVAPAPAKADAAPVPAPAKSTPKVSHAAHAGGGNNAPAGAAPRRPPPPVVPALKKAKGQIAKKKER
jgi:hypothetical protein